MPLGTRLGTPVDLLGFYSKRTSWTQQLNRLRIHTYRDGSSAVRPRRVVVAALPTSEVTSLVDGYRAGATAKDLAIEFGVHRTTVTQHLQRNGVPLRRRGLDDPQIDQAVHLYRQGWSLARIGTSLSVDAHTVRTALRARGVQMRDTRGRDR
jgi:hypothetical protein